MTLEETLNGGYAGLYSEVAAGDCYKLKELKFSPDVIFDLGANVGIFTRHARLLFPDALIISVEPDDDNFKHLVNFTPKENIAFINSAIGKGKMWKELKAINGSGIMYINSGIGFPEKGLTDREDFGGISEQVQVDTVMLSSLIEKYVNKGDKYLVKIDIEGNEHIIFTDELSVNGLKNADYVCIEIHLFSLNDESYKEIRTCALELIEEMKVTHDCVLDGDNLEKRHIDFWATKK